MTVPSTANCDFQVMFASKLYGMQYIIAMRAPSHQDWLSLRSRIPKEHTPCALIVRVVWKNDSPLQGHTKPPNLLGINGTSAPSLEVSTGSGHAKCHARSECPLNEFP